MTNRNIIWAVADQSSIAIAFFFVTFMLARELPQEAYGAFAMAYSILTLSQLLYQGVFYEPITIFGIGRFKSKFWNYALKILIVHFILALVVSAFYGLVAAFIENSNVKYAFIGLAISSPFILFYGIVRRFLYANFLTYQPALISIVYSFWIIGLIYLLLHLRSLSLLTVFGVLGSASLITGLIGLRILFSNKGPGSLYDVKISGVVNDHFIYGKYAAGSYAVNWIAGNSYFVALPLILGLEATGALKALLNFIAPVQQIIGALSLIYLPLFTRILSRQGGKLLDKNVKHYLLVIIALQIVNFLFYYFVGVEVLSLVYNGKYSELSGYILWIGLLPLIGGIAAPFSCVLRAMNYPAKILKANVFASLIVPFALLLAYFLDVNGALLGLILSSSISTIMVCYYYVNIRNSKIELPRQANSVNTT